MNLPPIIQTYITASNAHDVEAIVHCFADDAVVRDEERDATGQDRDQTLGNGNDREIQIPIYTAQRRTSTKPK